MPSDRLRLGGWLSTSDPLITEAAGRAGFDWVGIDLQHGAWDVGSAVRGIQLLDLLHVPVLVRVAEDELHLIAHVLDQGAGGIIVAMTSGPDSIREAVARSRYQPHGRRSYGNQRYGLRGEPADAAAIRPEVHAMVEGREAIRRVEGIAAVPGLSGIHVGPVDLCLDLGIGRDRKHPTFIDALQRVLAASRDAGVPAVMHAVSAEQAPGLRALGFDELVLTSDIELLRSAFAGILAAVRPQMVSR
jgi:2-keto-3-deoxy-L-rhamnonate aldolase RhmA